MKITCQACAHEAEVDGVTDPAREVLRCDECGARAAFGTLLPCVIVEPHEDERGVRWLRRRFQDPRTRVDLYVVDLDPQYAASEAKNILSLVLP